MESWRRVWRDGLSPLLSTSGLEALKLALQTDDPRLIQGATTYPPPLEGVQGWPIEAACATAYPGWQGDGLTTVAEAELYFAKKCFEADELLREPAGVRWFLNWYDETPRDEMRRELLQEVNRTLSLRGSQVNGLERRREES